ncbi:hypothetical protein AL036_01515 [Salipiger aestuarii]|uniref:Uncharacterized protein YjiS (DUF1127 family) n=1 Tax=Salipiger aestuarii TaxID=568098 RepID=A0A327YSM5_9RHOB|nr:DUF1127 domain-containing protein [Salipiger aestuarii]EIE51141.1 hypothetical protein C357_09992 [Citreicella sp. 357]KAA8610168.1 hypothetical protein AL036_01515 [Salipiger aestuarii]KAA8616022.1 hypothetical protein AL037_01985 [Salipiger aestuarii]KAB2543367.1 hypothetical protein AL035_02630 [Salipiger aestuarii]RAK23960.1 uncharacterized protein YjiS (DUF1127 family) [Salipiger aestuarii]
MSAYDSFRTDGGAAGLAGRIGSVFVTGYGAAPAQGASVSVEIAAKTSRFVATVADAIIDWHEARQTRKSLSALTDRELDDIGLTRGDIEMVARGRW